MGDIFLWPPFITIKNITWSLKVNSGTSHMTCLPRRDSSEANVKETFLFHSKDGSILILMWDVQQSGDNLCNQLSHCNDKLLNSSTAQIWDSWDREDFRFGFLRFSTIKKMSSHAQIWPQGAEIESIVKMCPNAHCCIKFVCTDLTSSDRTTGSWETAK